MCPLRATGPTGSKLFSSSKEGNDILEGVVRAGFKRYIRNSFRGNRSPADSWMLLGRSGLHSPSLEITAADLLDEGRHINEGWASLMQGTSKQQIQRAASRTAWLRVKGGEISARLRSYCSGDSLGAIFTRAMGRIVSPGPPPVSSRWSTRGHYSAGSIAIGQSEEFEQARVARHETIDSTTARRYSVTTAACCEISS
jgi:hypothetical protein